MTLIVLAVERYLATVHPLTFEGFCSVKVSTNRFILRAKDLYRVLETLKELIMKNGDDKSRIFYLKVNIKGQFSDGLLLILVLTEKVDIEGYELDALPEWIESGALEKVFVRPLPVQPRRGNVVVSQSYSITIF